MTLHRYDIGYALIPGSGAVAWKNAAEALSREYELGQELHFKRTAAVKRLDAILESAARVGLPVVGGLIEAYAITTVYAGFMQAQADAPANITPTLFAIGSKIGTYIVGRLAEEYGRKKCKELESLRE